MSWLALDKVPSDRGVYRNCSPARSTVSRLYFDHSALADSPRAHTSRMLKLWLLAAALGDHEIRSPPDIGKQWGISSTTTLLPRANPEAFSGYCLQHNVRFEPCRQWIAPEKR